jgi:hypothetical protein
MLQVFPRPGGPRRSRSRWTSQVPVQASGPVVEPAPLDGLVVQIDVAVAHAHLPGASAPQARCQPLSVAKLGPASARRSPRPKSQSSNAQLAPDRHTVVDVATVMWPRCLCGLRRRPAEIPQDQPDDGHITSCSLALLRSSENVLTVLDRCAVADAPPANTPDHDRIGQRPPAFPGNR